MSDTYAAADTSGYGNGGGASTWTSSPTQQSAYQFFLGKGWSPAQAAGIVGGLRGETADLNPAQSHDNGIGLGIAGWNGPRRAALEQYASQRQVPPTNLGLQLDFLDHELRTTEKSAGSALSATDDPAAAGRAMLRYFRPTDWDTPGAHPERARYAQELFNATQGSGGGAPSGQSDLLASLRPAQARASTDQLLGAGSLPNGGSLALPHAAPMSPPAPVTPQRPAMLGQPQLADRVNAVLAGDPQHVAGPVEYIRDSRGNARKLIPVKYDPFA